MTDLQRLRHAEREFQEKDSDPKFQDETCKGLFGWLRDQYGIRRKANSWSQIEILDEQKYLLLVLKWP